MDEKNTTKIRGGKSLSPWFDWIYHMRGFTKEEAQANEEYLNTLFKPTGITFDDITEPKE